LSTALHILKSKERLTKNIRTVNGTDDGWH